MSTNQNHIGIPDNIGRLIIENASIIQRPVLGTDKFIDFCMPIDQDRLLRLERLGLFSPIFRVKTPDTGNSQFQIPIKNGKNWFEDGWAWDTTAIKQNYKVPHHNKNPEEAYYSVFQIEHLQLIVNHMSLEVHMDSFLEDSINKKIDWNSNGKKWFDIYTLELERLKEVQFRRAVPLLCQYISNRYYPLTQSDERTMQIHKGHYSDRWISMLDHNWNWSECARNWNPQTVVDLFELTPEKLKHAYTSMAMSIDCCDPLKRWYQLIQFVDVRERQKLSGDALRAETLRDGANMLRLLYKDLYQEDLPVIGEVFGTVINHIPELEIRQDSRRYLEFVANRYGLNPQPKLVLIVEGQSEEIAVNKLFEEYFGAHPGKLSIEIVVLGSVDNATGSKREDRYRAILRLVDYLHHHQTFAFIILDNENSAGKLKDGARNFKSILSESRYATRPEYIKIWKIAFEFDNFSNSEIAVALTEIADGHSTFFGKEIESCRKHKNPGSALQKLYKDKTQYGLPKLELNEKLVQMIFSQRARRKIENRPIIKVLEKVSGLAMRNPLPTMQKAWQTNQDSKYLGKKRQKTKPKIQTKKRN